MQPQRKLNEESDIQDNQSNQSSVSSQDSSDDHLKSLNNSFKKMKQLKNEDQIDQEELFEKNFAQVIDDKNNNNDQIIAQTQLNQVDQQLDTDRTSNVGNIKENQLPMDQINQMHNNDVLYPKFNFRKKFIREIVVELSKRKKVYEKFKSKFDRFNQELSKSQLELDVGIMQGLLSQNLIQDIRSSFGQNSLYYTVTLGPDTFQSEKVSDSFRTPQWKETFTFTLERETDKLLFEIFRHNSSEGRDLQIDQFEFIIGENIEKLKDQNSHQITITSEKENGFHVVVKWRYEESGVKLQTLRKKILQLKDKLTADQEQLRCYRESYEKLLNFKGDGSVLLQQWRLDNVKNKNLENQTFSNGQSESQQDVQSNNFMSGVQQDQTFSQTLDNSYPNSPSKNQDSDEKANGKKRSAGKLAKRKKVIGKVSHNHSRNISQNINEINPIQNQESSQSKFNNQPPFLGKHSKNESASSQMMSRMLANNNKIAIQRPNRNMIETEPNTLKHKDYPLTNINENQFDSSFVNDRSFANMPHRLDSSDSLGMNNNQMVSGILRFDKQYESAHVQNDNYGFYDQFNNPNAINNNNNNMNTSLLSNGGVQNHNYSPESKLSQYKKQNSINKKLNTSQPIINQLNFRSPIRQYQENSGTHLNFENNNSRNLQESQMFPSNFEQNMITNPSDLSHNTSPDLNNLSNNNQNNLNGKNRNQIGKTKIKVPELLFQNQPTAQFQNYNDDIYYANDLDDHNQNTLSQKIEDSHREQQLYEDHTFKNTQNPSLTHEDQALNNLTNFSETIKMQDKLEKQRMQQKQEEEQQQIISQLEAQQTQQQQLENTDQNQDKILSELNIDETAQAPPPLISTRRNPKKNKQMHEFHFTEDDKILQKTPQFETQNIDGDIVGSVEFVESRLDALKTRKQLDFQESSEPMKRMLTSNKMQKTETQDIEDLSDKNILNTEDLSMSVIETANNEQTSTARLNTNQDLIDDLQKQINDIMRQSECQQQSLSLLNSKQSSPDSNEFLQNNNDPTAFRKNNKNGMKAMHQFELGNDNLGHNKMRPFNDEDAVNSRYSIDSKDLPPLLKDTSLINQDSSNSKEILEPTLKNLKRMELKNQRRDMQSSLVSSSINAILEKQSRNTFNQSASQYNGSNNNSQQLPVPPLNNNQSRSQFKFGSMSQNGSMFRFGAGMGIGQLMKSLDAGSVIGKQALMKEMKHQQEFEDTQSQRSGGNGSFFSPAKQFGVGLGSLNNSMYGFNANLQNNIQLSNSRMQSMYQQSPMMPLINEMPSAEKYNLNYQRRTEVPQHSNGMNNSQQFINNNNHNQQQTSTSGFGFYFKKLNNNPSSIFNGEYYQQQL
eukprot:403374285